MPYVEIRGKKQTGKTSLGLLYASRYDLVVVAESHAVARRWMERSEYTGSQPIRYYRTFKALLDGTRECKGVVVDEVHTLEPLVDEPGTIYWGSSIEENLRRLAKTGMWVVAIFREEEPEHQATNI